MEAGDFRKRFRLGFASTRRVSAFAAVLLLCAAHSTLASRNIVEVRNPYAERPVQSQSMKLEEDLRIGGGSEEEFFFSGIGDIAVDAAGRIYVAESSQNKVLVFDEDGNLIGSFGRLGQGPGDFTRPAGLAVDNEGLIYVADQFNVSIFDSTRTFVRSFNYGIPGGLVNGLVLNAEKCVFISCFEIYEQQMIHKYSNDGKRLESFCDSYAAGTKEDIRTEQTYAGGAIDIDKDGGIYFSQRTPYLIQKYSDLGELLMIVDRENGFVREPVVKIKGETREYYFGTTVYGFGLLQDGTMINSIVFARNEMKNYPWPSFIDVFSKSGDLVGSVGLDPIAVVYCVDRLDRMYFGEFGEQQQVVRHRLKR